MTALRDFLAREQDRLTYRGLAEHTKISRGALEAIINGKTKELPRLETLIRIAKAYNKPLWEVQRMAGVDLDLPKSADEVAARLGQLIVQVPGLATLVDRLIARWDTDPDFVKGFLIGLEAQVNGLRGPHQE